MASSRRENQTRRVTSTKLRGKLSVSHERVCQKKVNEAEVAKDRENTMENQQKVVESLTVVSYEALDFNKSHFSNPLEAGAAMEKEKIVNKNNNNKSHLPVMRSKEEEFQRFTEKYPLIMEKEPPPLKRCFAESKVHGKYLYDRWRNLQNTMRVDYIIASLQDHRPDEEEVKKYIGHQMWQNNLPRAKEILAQWKKRRYSRNGH